MKGEKRGAAKKNTTTFFKPSHRSQLNGSSLSRSITASPALGASRSPFPLGASQTSVPAASSQEVLKAAALKSTLLHVLAIRPTTLKIVAKQIRCSPSECEKLFSTHALPSRDDPSKSDLDPKAYKELDIWKFPYQSDSDRQSAIDRAVKAFDKLRITPSDTLWQQLLPKHDRGKGISLSKLDFRNGPLQKVSTPIIHVENAEHATLTDGSDEKSDKQSRLHPRDDEADSLSPATTSVKKRKISEKEAQMKRLSKKPPKNPPKKAATKEPKAKKPPKASARDKEGKKGSPKITPKIKSAEFVHDSDEDDAMQDIVPEPAIEKEPSRAAPHTDTESLADSSIKPKDAKTSVDKGAEIQSTKMSTTARNKRTEQLSLKPAPKSATEPTTKSTAKTAAKTEDKPSAMSERLNVTGKVEDVVDPITIKKPTAAAKSAAKVNSPLSNVTKPKIRQEVVSVNRASDGGVKQKKMALDEKTSVEAKGKKGNPAMKNALGKKTTSDQGNTKRNEVPSAAEAKTVPLTSTQHTPGNGSNASTTSTTRPSASTMRRTFSHQRNTSSPHKPSPLASSPPTNASELDHQIPGYQASSTKTTPNSSSGTKESPPSKPIHPKGVARKIGPPTSNPVGIKRKADAMDNGTIKPKVNGVSRPSIVKEAIFGRAPKASTSSPHPNKRHQTQHPSNPNGHLDTLNSKLTPAGELPNPPKVIQKPPTPSPSPSLSESASPSPTITNGETRVQKGIRFKKYYAEYEKLHLRLEAVEPADRDPKLLEKVKRMRQVLIELKADLAKKGEKDV